MKPNFPLLPDLGGLVADMEVSSDRQIFYYYRKCPGIFLELNHHSSIGVVYYDGAISSQFQEYNNRYDSRSDLGEFIYFK